LIQGIYDFPKNHKKRTTAGKHDVIVNKGIPNNCEVSTGKRSEIFI